MSSDLASLDRVFKALADPTRVRILGLLLGGEVCVCHVYESLKIPQPKASRHLAYLRRAGLVAGERRGLWVHYRLADQEDVVLRALTDAVRHCIGHLSTTTRDRERLRKKTGCCVAVPEAANPAAGLPCCCAPACAVGAQG
jgi:ArsR family transcriptional regulator